MMKCRVCQNGDNNTSYEAQEMMFGFRDAFRYFQCAACNCLQIGEFPANISKYYPDTYYSYQQGSSPNSLKRHLVRLRNQYAVFGKGLLGKLLYRKHPHAPLQSLSSLSLDKNAHILDVGCGSGQLLRSLHELGFKNLLGADPFVAEDMEYEGGVKVVKKELDHIGGAWDLIMFHHSFEHIPDPTKTLQAVSRLLKPNGQCVIRIPTVTSFAWTYYGVKWVQLDAPRHFYLHSVKSMKVLAENAGLKIHTLTYDSASFQFWGSEQYTNDIPLRDARSYELNPRLSIFSKREISKFAEHADALNRVNQGDQAIFYLKKSKS